jgi:tryptophanyl-tRNA synthetase
MSHESVSVDPVATTTTTAATSGQKVTPWEVEAAGGVDYEKLMRDFGAQAIDAALIARIERATGRKAHVFLRRGLFYSHRDLEAILAAHEAGQPFYLYTGRGPSSDSLHFGHLVPFMFTKYLQEAFDVPLVVQMTDDEKFLWKGHTLDEVHKFLIENVKDIIACGFDIQKTFIFSNFAYMGHMYPLVVQIQRLISAHTAAAAFGFDDQSNVGKWAFPATQAAPSFSSAFPHIFGGRKDVPCLIPCAIDQDPYFRVTRDVAPRLGLLKPSLIHSKFFPALQGHHTKMGASDPNSAIFLTDDPRTVADKVKKHAFSGGRATKEEQLAQGANLEVDVAYQWLRFFLDDDDRIDDIGRRYAKGDETMLTGHVKQILIDVLNDMIAKHKAARAQLTDATVATFMAVRKM